MVQGVDHDADPHVQEFLKDFFEKTSALWQRGCTGAGNDQEAKYISRKTLRENLNVERIESLLGDLFPGPSEQRPSAGIIHDGYLRPFAILLCQGAGEMIKYFIRYESLGDSALPFYQQPKEFPRSTTQDMWGKFYREQWHYCALNLSFDMDKQLDCDQILPLLPIDSKDHLGTGRSASTYLVSVDPQFDALTTSENNDVVKYHISTHTGLINTS